MLRDVVPALLVGCDRGAFYPAGIPIAAVNTDEEEVEPWISEDCRMLYFRRGESIMSAEAAVTVSR